MDEEVYQESLEPKETQDLMEIMVTTTDHRN